ncbi:hypothetical protein GCM10027418_02670 [Mariniluteicoccus endophyticus]
MTAISSTLAVGLLTGAAPARAADHVLSGNCSVNFLDSTVRPDSRVPRSQRYDVDRRGAVDALNCWLVENGYPLRSREFNRDMERAVSKFNAANGLGSSPVATPATWTALTRIVPNMALYRVAMHSQRIEMLLTGDGAGKVQKEYASGGLTIPGTVQEIMAQGRPVSAAEAVPGDVVLFRIPANDPRRTGADKRVPIHPEYSVGIYSGRGYAYRVEFYLIPPGDPNFGYGSDGYWQWIGGRLQGADGQLVDGATFFRMVP